MRNYRLTIFVVLSLLAQQAAAGVFNASMLGHSLSLSISSETLPMSNGERHEHHSMASHGESVQEIDKSSQAQAANSDCCSASIECDLLCSASVVANFSTVFASLNRSHAIWHYSSEPLAQSLDTLFRPPIFA